MNEITAVDMNAICAYCGKPKILCDCHSTVKAMDIIEDRILRIYEV